MVANRRPQDFEALSRDILSSSPCLVEMPAGTGKTQLLVTMASVLSTKRCRILILTHTNAGVAAIESRLRRSGLPLRGITVATVASWAERVSASYPCTSGINRSLARDVEGYFNDRVRSARELASTDWFSRVIASSYQALLVDEYQDCNQHQHDLVVTLSRSISKTVVLGDPLQRIFDFKGELFPSWEMVQRSFPAFTDISPYPHRWSGHNLELGEWLLDGLRPALLADGDIVIPSCSGRVMQYLGRTDDDALLGRSAYHLASMAGSSLIICPNLPPGADERLARRLSKRYSCIETVEGSFMRSQLIAYLDARPKGDVHNWAAGFAKACASKIVDGLDKTVLNAISSGKPLDRYLSTSKRIPYSEVLTSLADLAGCPSAQTIEKFRRAVEGSPAMIFRWEAWRDTLASIVEYERNGTNPLIVFEARRNAGKHFAGRNEGNIVSRTLLVKGLEFSNVLVTNACEGNRYTPQNLYVALTRATDRLLLLG